MTALYQAPLVPGVGNTTAGFPANYAPTRSPFFSTANQFLPRNLHDVIKWVRFITAQSPVTTEVLRKLATFPITGFTYNSDDTAVRNKYQTLVKGLCLKQVLHDIGFQYFTTGNVFISIYYPIQRSFKCPDCLTSYAAQNAEFIKYQAYEFRGKCPKCNNTKIFDVVDTKSTHVKDMSVIVWDPLNIAVNHNPITGKSKYYYKIPNEVKRRIQLGDMLYMESTPWEIIEAVRKNKDFEFTDGEIFHLRNVDTGFAVAGISIPPLVSHFTLVFYQAQLRRANEAIAGDFMAPLRVIFPQAQTGNSDPVVSISMANFTANMEAALVGHKLDSSRVLIAPVPIGYQAVSGEGKTLLIAQEIQQAEQSLLLSLGVSQELLSGSTNWTSSTVGLRMLKNTLDSYVGQILDVMGWLSEKCGSYNGWPACEIGLTPFQLTDDESLKSILMSLLQGGNVSLTTVYEAMGRSYDEEQERMLEEAKSQARMQVRLAYEVQQSKYLEGLELSKAESEDDGYKETLQKAQQTVAELGSMDPVTRQQVMTQMQFTDFPMHILVQHILTEAQNDPLNTGGGAGTDPNAPGAGSNGGGNGGDPSDDGSQQQNGGSQGPSGMGDPESEGSGLLSGMDSLGLEQSGGGGKVPPSQPKNPRGPTKKK